VIKQVFEFLTNLSKFSRTLKGDVIFYYYPASGSFLDLICVFFVRFYLKRKIYLEVNEVRKYATTPVNTTQDKMKKFLTTFLLEQTFYFYHGLICISNIIAGYYERKNKNILVVPILCDVPTKGKRITPIQNVSEGPRLILFVGSVAFEKENIGELIKGIDLLLKDGLDILMHFHGSITEDSRIKFDSLLEKLGISDFVKYCGPYNNANVFDIIAQADAVILPRDNSKQNHYGFSTKLSEYIISGRPIIMTNTGVLSSYFKDGFNCIMVDGYDSNSFYVKIKYYLNLNRIDRDLISLNSYKTALHYFDFRIYADVMSEFLS
jgi:glycosyltransferase involved in cell wall biosynthesis